MLLVSTCGTVGQTFSRMAQLPKKADGSEKAPASQEVTIKILKKSPVTGVKTKICQSMRSTQNERCIKQSRRRHFSIFTKTNRAYSYPHRDGYSKKIGGSRPKCPPHKRNTGRLANSGRSADGSWLLPQSGQFKQLHGDPLPPSTHELYAWNEGAAKPLYGHCERVGTSDKIFVFDRLWKTPVIWQSGRRPCCGFVPTRHRCPLKNFNFTRKAPFPEQRSRRHFPCLSPHPLTGRDSFEQPRRSFPGAFLLQPCAHRLENP